MKILSATPYKRFWLELFQLWIIELYESRSRIVSGTKQLRVAVSLLFMADKLSFAVDLCSWIGFSSSQQVAEVRSWLASSNKTRSSPRGQNR